MYTNTSCTLFLKSKDYKPVVIPHCFLTYTSIASANRVGLDYSETAQCLFKGNEDLHFTLGKDLLIEGVTDLTVDTTSSKTLSESLSKIQYEGGVTIMKADYKNYGSKFMRHWELSCR